MLVEAPVLGGDERLLHEIGNVGERHPDAPVAGLEHVGKIRALAVEHRAHARQLPALEARLVGQIGRGVVEELDHLAEIDHRIGDGLVLAELVIGGIEVGEIDAVKGLDVGADRLRVVERGGDQVVDIDRFDVERLAHMGAAGAQRLHHLVLVGHGIEMGLHRLRLGHDLAERERGRENLDEDQVHHGEGINSPVGGTPASGTASIAIRSLQKDFFADPGGGAAEPLAATVRAPHPSTISLRDKLYPRPRGFQQHYRFSGDKPMK